MAKILLWTIIVIRIVGTGLFLVIDPLSAYAINGLLDAIDGPHYKHLIKINPVTAQIIDKALDLWMYCMAYITLPNLPIMSMHFLTATFVVRLIGQFVFFAIKDRRVLLFFPNFFEVTYVFVFILQIFQVDFLTSMPLLMLLYLGKIVHEYILHHKEITIFDHVLVPGLQLLRKKHQARRVNKRR